MNCRLTKDKQDNIVILSAKIYYRFTTGETNVVCLTANTMMANRVANWTASISKPCVSSRKNQNGHLYEPVDQGGSGAYRQSICQEVFGMKYLLRYRSKLRCNFDTGVRDADNSGHSLETSSKAENNCKPWLINDLSSCPLRIYLTRHLINPNTSKFSREGRWLSLSGLILRSTASANRQ